MIKEQPNYYAIIPANVRYDETLSPFEKLMYGEITCLTAKDGKCWASNNYFSNLYKKDLSTIRRSITALVTKGYLKRVINKNVVTNRVESRYLFINMQSEIPVGKNAPTLGAKMPLPGGKNAQYNNTSNNNTSIKEKNIKKENDVLLNKEVLDAFVEHRKSLKSPVTKYAIRLLYKKAQKCVEQGLVDSPEEAFNISIERGWKGINPEWIREKVQIKKHKTVNDMLKELKRV